MKNSSVECTALALCSPCQLWAHTYTCTATHLCCVLQFKALWYGVLVMGQTGASQQEVRVSSRKGEWKMGCSEFQLMISSIYILTTALFTLYASNSRGLHPCIHCEIDLLDYLLHCWVVDIRITLWNIVFVLNVLQVSGTSKGFFMERPVPYFLSPGIPDGSLNNTEIIAYWNTTPDNKQLCTKYRPSIAFEEELFSECFYRP